MSDDNVWIRERRHFPFIPEKNIVFCGDKRVVDADYLIDDEAKHFAGFRGTGILFSAPQTCTSGGMNASQAGNKSAKSFWECEWPD